MTLELSTFVLELSPSPDAPWRWADGGRVLTWTEGESITFAPELQRLLARLASESRCVPPFLALVLMMGLVRSQRSSNGVEDFRRRLSDALGNTPGAAEQRAAAHEQLRHVVELAPEVAGCSESLEEVVVHLVERSGLPRDPERASRYADRAQRGFTAEEFAVSGARGPIALRDWLHALTILHTGLAAFDARALEFRARTGLDEAPGAADVWIDCAPGAARFIDDDDHGPARAAIAALAAEVRAMTHLQRALDVRSDLPLGGVSDLANRGSFERLLMSELAFDDVTLAARIATGEALYWRREVPRGKSDARRCIFVETGILTWGSPRAFAAAVALGLAAGSEGRPAHTWCTADGRLAAVDLDGPRGVALLLERLDVEPDPSNAIDTFFALDVVAEPTNEVCLVLSAAAAAAPEVNMTLRAHAARGFFLALVDGQGALRIERWGAQGAIVVHEARLDLAPMQRAILRAPLLRTDERLEDDPELPRCLQLRPLPIRVPFGRPPSDFCSEDGRRRGAGFALTHSGDVQRFTDWQRAPIVLDLTAVEPRPAVFELDDHRRLHVVGRQPQLERWSWSCYAPEGRLWTLDLPELPKYVHIVRVGERIVAETHKQISVFERHGDGLRVVRGVPCPSRILGRYCVSSDGAERLFVLTFMHGSPTLEPVSVRADLPGKIIGAFDWPGREGPWLIVRDSGLIISSVTGDGVVIKGLRLQRCRRVRQIAPELIQIDDDVVLDLKAGEVVTLAKLIGEWLPRRESALRRLSAIGWNNEGELVVEARSTGRRYVPRVTPARHGMPARLQLQSDPSSDSHMVRFERDSALRAESHLARTEHGNRAWVGPRSLLHLRSPNVSVPEVSLALIVDRPLRVWCELGGSYGLQGEPIGGQTLDAEQALELIRAHREGYP